MKSQSQTHKSHSLLKFSCFSSSDRVVPEVKIVYTPSATPAPAPQPKKSSTARSQPTALSKAMNELYRKVSQRDTMKIFAQPVTEDIAPGYFQVITTPMDLSTVRSKLQRDEYQTLREFRDDIYLMIRNCMTYNPETTIFYQQAANLLAFFKRQFKMTKQTIMGDQQQTLESTLRAFTSDNHQTLKTIEGVNIPVVQERRQSKQPPFEMPKPPQQGFAYASLKSLPKSFQPPGDDQKFTLVCQTAHRSTSVRKGLKKLLDKFPIYVVEEALKSFAGVSDDFQPSQDTVKAIFAGDDAINAGIAVAGETPAPIEYIRSLSKQLPSLNLESASQIRASEDPEEALMRLMFFYDRTLKFWPDEELENAKKLILEAIKSRIAGEALKLPPSFVVHPTEHTNIVLNLTMVASKHSQ